MRNKTPSVLSMIGTQPMLARYQKSTLLRRTDISC